jgi:hypothetical protein
MQDEAEKPPVKRTAGGQFVPGVSGNPAGRAKGTKNKITLARLMLEDQLREILTQEGPKLMRKAIKMALKDGNDRVMRVLLDKMLTTPKDQDSGESQDRDIKVTVQNLIPSGAAQRPAIEGDSVRIPVTIPLPKD